jgi:hypothetical protein
MSNPIVKEDEIKNFRQKKCCEGEACIYDYNIYKINKMIVDIEDLYGFHPDVDALALILDMYRHKEIDIFWKGGLPMPKISGSDGYYDIDVSWTPL